MHPDLEMIAPAAIALVAVLTLWLTLTAWDTRPDSGVLIIPSDDASYYSIS